MRVHLQSCVLLLACCLCLAGCGQSAQMDPPDTGAPQEALDLTQQALLEEVPKASNLTFQDYQTIERYHVLAFSCRDNQQTLNHRQQWGLCMLEEGEDGWKVLDLECNGDDSAGVFSPSGYLVPIEGREEVLYCATVGVKDYRVKSFCRKGAEDVTFPVEEGKSLYLVLCELTANPVFPSVEAIDERGTVLSSIN